MTTPEPTELELADQLKRLSPTPLYLKIAAAFPGVVVRKDLVNTVKGNAIVPTYVLEYLLGQYAATDDEATIRSGMSKPSSGTTTGTEGRTDSSSRVSGRRAATASLTRSPSPSMRDWTSMSPSSPTLASARWRSVQKRYATTPSS